MWSKSLGKWSQVPQSSCLERKEKFLEVKETGHPGSSREANPLLVPNWSLSPLPPTPRRAAWPPAFMREDLRCKCSIEKYSWILWQGSISVFPNLTIMGGLGLVPQSLESHFRNVLFHVQLANRVGEYLLCASPFQTLTSTGENTYTDNSITSVWVGLIRTRETNLIWDCDCLSITYIPIFKMNLNLQTSWGQRACFFLPFCRVI